MCENRIRMATALASAAVLVLAVASTAHAGSKPPPSTAHGGLLQVRPVADQNFCLDVDESSGQPAVVVSLCSPVLSQRFTFSEGADGRNLLIDIQGRCLVRGAKLAKDFYRVAVEPCTYQMKERWFFSSTGELADATGHHCAGIVRPAALVEVHLEPCGAFGGQQWKLAQ